MLSCGPLGIEFEATALKPETHCTIFGCPRRKIGIVKQSWQIRNRLGQPKFVQCVSHHYYCFSNIEMKI